MKLSDVKKVRAECAAAVKTKRYGEDEAPYVAYYWSLRRSRKRNPARWGTVLGFEVLAEDVAIFPELAGRLMIAVRDTEGIVHETSAEDAAWETMKGG